MTLNLICADCGKPIVCEGCSGTIKPDPFKEREEKFVSYWNTLEGVAKVEKMSLKRQVHFRTRMKEKGWATKAAKAMKMFPLKCFVASGWKPNIEWFFRPDTVDGILDGKHDFGDVADDGKSKREAEREKERKKFGC